MRSHFSAQTLAEIFRDLYVGERSGVLVLNRDEHEKRVAFDRGMILYAESSLEEEQLGHVLVREGRLSAGALSEASEALNGARGTVNLGRALVHRELIGRKPLCKAAWELVLRVVESVFGWEGGSARFSEATAPRTVFETDILATVDVIFRGIACMAGFEPIHEAMRGLDNRLRLRRPCGVPVWKLPLSPSHGFILSRVDGNTSLNDVIAILPPDEEERASRFIFGMLIFGALEYDPPLGSGSFKVADILKDHADRRALERMQEQTILQAYSQVRDQNPHEILGISPESSPKSIERAYEETKAQFARERLLPRVRDKLRNELTLIESRLIESYLALTKPEAPDRSPPGGGEAGVDNLNVRVEMDKTRTKVALEEATRVADGYFAKAKQYRRDGDFYNAIQYAKLAITHHASDARYHALLAECQAKNPEQRWQRMAEDNYTRATQLDPWNPEYWIQLALLYKRQGLRLRARKKFEEALKLVPNHPEILRELEDLE